MTTTEIANLLGISRGTVSRVINNQPNVKEETRQMILEALEKYGYTPNETARSLVMKKSIRIAVIIFSDPKFFWEQVTRGITSAYNELRSFGLEVDYYVTDILHPEEQLKLLQDLPSKGYHGIAIAPNVPQMLVEEISRLSSRNFPIVIINVEIPSVEHLCYIGCDYIQAGILAGEIMTKSMDYHGEVAILALKDPVISVDQRITGFRRELPNYKEISITHICRFSRMGEGVYEGVYNLISEHPEITGIFVSFAGMEQTSQAILDLGLQSKKKVVGYDLNDDIYSGLKKGSITSTICHEPYHQGYFAVKILYRYLNHGIRPSSSVMYNKLEAIFSTNAKYYLEDQMQIEMLLYR